MKALALVLFASSLSLHIEASVNKADTTIVTRDDSTALEPEGTRLPDVVVFAQSRPILKQMKINKLNPIATQSAQGGVNVIGLLLFAADKLLPHHHKETPQERAKRICNAY